MASILAVGEVNQFRGDFGEAWVEAVCLAGGYVPDRQDHDRHGFDLTIIDDASEMVRVQVKTTEHPVISGAHLKLDLDVRTYDKLREGTTAGLLIVVVISREYPNWIRQGLRRALVRVEGYWLSLAGRPATSNTTTIAVELPLQNRFQPETVGRLFE